MSLSGINSRLKYAPTMGHPTRLDPALVDTLVSNTPRGISPGIVAGLSGVPRRTFYHWLTRGEEDVMNNKDTLLAQLFKRYTIARANATSDILSELRTCPRNYGALTFILERCNPEEFVTKSEMQVQLENFVFNIIQPMLKQGNYDVIENQEFYPEGNKETGCAAPGTEGSGGEEDTGIKD